eukprot:GHVU01049018.1.p1 GENE.GHVU01049018.1~~GHVU01049018.1.p1  ORF type:complete len:193 (+),score=34.06 GHVU01049018.1:297-875(+)
MANTIAVSSAVSSFVAPAALVEARSGAISAAQGLGGAERSAYGANVVYAAALNDAFGFAWFTFKDAGELKKKSPAFAAEKEEFYKAYRSVREVSNMSAIWAQIKSYGEKDAKNRELFGWFNEETAEGETETESESGGAGAAKRSPDLFIAEDMSAAFKRLMRDDEQLSDKGKVFRGALLAALKDYGITGLEG